MRCQEIVAGADLYEGLLERGLEYGPSFRGVERLWRRDGEALGRLRLTEAVATQRIGHKIHPALLDACFQVLAAALPKGSADGEDPFLPVGLARLHLDDLPDTGLWAHALLKSDAPADADYLEGDVFLLDERGQVLLEASGLRLQRLERDARPENEQEDLDDWLYEVRWEPKELPSTRSPRALVPRPACELARLRPTQAGSGRHSRDCWKSMAKPASWSSLVMSTWKRGRGAIRLDPADPEHFLRLLADLAEADSLPLEGRHVPVGPQSASGYPHRILRRSTDAWVYRRIAPDAGFGDVGGRAPALAGDA